MSKAAKPTRVIDAPAGSDDDMTGEPIVKMKAPAQAAVFDDARQFLELRAGGTLLAVDATSGQRPRILYCGPDIPGATGAEFALLSTGQHAPGGPGVHLQASLLNEFGTGTAGPSGLIAHREGRDWAIDLRVEKVDANGDGQVVVHCLDPNTKVQTRHDLSLDQATGMLRSATTITNLASEPLSLDWCAAICMPIDQRLDRIHGFTGRWSNEFQPECISQFHGSYVRENKAGRTSHDSFPGLIVATSQTSETTGLAAAFHLGWSGNSRLRLDRHNDGQAFVQMGELPFPGEFRLSQGESYSTPDIYCAWTHNGLGELSDKFHRYFSDQILGGRIDHKPRPVHFNTWEAVYFDHSQDRLMALADKAAAIGAERFVLDDGWFGGRRNDGAGLGDWWVSPDVYPQGLGALVDKVHLLGMEFGLWLEPEMVNPDSDLFRAHPDWVLQAEGVETIPFRQQLTLDLTRPEVFDYLLEKMSAVIAEYQIAYIKWDMNRDTNHPGSHGRAAMHNQTRAVYRLMRTLRDRHPKLEIESCSSGGARADYGIMRHADRIWTSDNNDAHARQSIQRGASHFFPLKIMGSHVGPRRCHVTGRVFSMEYRVATAMFGHMGMELDLADETEEALDVLAQGISLHKQYRELIHSGRFIRFDTPEDTNVMGCVARDKSEALISYAQIQPPAATLPSRVHLNGLDRDRDYRVRLIWPPGNPTISSPSIVDAADLLGEGSIVSGAALMEHGFQPPLALPDTCQIYHLKAEG